MFDREADIAFNQRIAPGFRLMGLNAPDLAAAVKPGQFVMLRVRSGDDPLLRRPFSVAGLRAGGGLLLLYRVVGRGTRILSGLRPDERVRVLGPVGRGFSLPAEGSTPLLVAGGIGLAPLLFLSSALDSAAWRLLCGFRSGSEVIPPEPLGLDPGRLLITTEDGSRGRRGLVTDLLEERLSAEPDAARCTIFACGPPAMLRRVASLAAERGVPCQVSLEARMACALGACQGCAVKAARSSGRTFHLVCQDGPVFDAADLDWGEP